MFLLLVSVLSGKNAKAVFSKLNEKNKNATSSSVNGLRISVSELLINRARQQQVSSDVSAIESTSELLPKLKLSKNTETASKIIKENKKSPSRSPAINKANKYKDFGEFRHFKEQEIPAPRQLKICKRNNSQGIFYLFLSLS